MKPDHRVLLCCAIAWLCCAAVKCEEEFLDGNTIKEDNSVLSNWPERDESGISNILKQMYRDIERKPLYDDDDEGEDSCDKTCGTATGVTCVPSGNSEEGKSFECKCSPDTDKMFDYSKKECRKTCEKSDNSCENNAQCIQDKKDSNSRFCQCLKGTSGDQCGFIEDCLGEKGKYITCTGDKGTCTFDGKEAKCTCETAGTSLKESLGHCEVCDCGKSADSCKFDKENADKKVCTCKTDKYEQIGEECKRVSCKETCGLPNSAETGVICNDETEDITCTCDSEDNKFNAKGKKCEECKCGENSISCEFEDGKKKCNCQKGFADKVGTCEACDCGPKSNECRFIKGVQTCNCTENHKEDEGICKECICGENSLSCEFKDGNKKCNCKKGFEDNDGKCEACECGPYSNKCRFVNGEKICDCKAKYSVKNGKCEECDCGMHKCYFVDEHRICHCESGYVKNADGMCTIPKEDCQRKCGKAPNVICDVGSTLNNISCSCNVSEKKYDHKTWTCKKPCSSDASCKNGGNCTADEKIEENKFCRCLPGTSEDLCEKIDECDKTFVRCVALNGICKYDVEEQEAFCQCPPKFSYHDMDGYCEACDCGPESKKCSFVYGEKVCDCKENYSVKKGKCEECDCGKDGVANCTFDENSLKKCACIEKYKENRGQCELCDCGKKSHSCDFVDGEKKCECHDGYKNIDGICKASTICVEKCGMEDDSDVKCDQHNETSATCSCPKDNKKFDYGIKRCRHVCESNDTCVNAAICKADLAGENNTFCSCLPRTSGDKCEIVQECKGKYENCTGERGTCSYNVEKKRGECKCDGGKKLKDLGGFCEACDCGPKGKECKFIQDAKTCECEENYKDNLGTCEECICGVNSISCDFKNGTKQCNCKKGYADDDGICKECECGPHSKKCSFVGGIKHCECHDGYSIKDGTCEECDCGTNSHNCSFDKDLKKICSCKSRHSDDRGTCKACDCGENSIKCSFKEEGEINCECKNGFAQKDDTCAACTCGIFTKPCNFTNGIKTCECIDNYAEKGENCTACNCGDKSTGCKFDNDVAICDCKEGYGNKDSKCKEDKCFTICKVAFNQVKDEAKCEGDAFGSSDNIKCNCEGASDVKFDYTLKKCRLTCDGAEDCKNGAKCGPRSGSRDSPNFCLCPRGTAGDTCKEIKECGAEGKYAKCTGGDRGDCKYDAENERARCICPKERKLDEVEGYCQKKCEKDADCTGEKKICHANKYCTCEKGKSGDNCEINIGCTVDFKSKCEKANAECVFSKTSPTFATCNCSNENYFYDAEKNHCISKFCKDVGCKDSAKCNFNDLTKTGYCKCTRGFYDYKRKICQEPDKCVLTKSICKENFECIDGKCVCKYGDKEGEKCIRPFCTDNTCFSKSECHEDAKSCLCKDKEFFDGSKCKDAKCFLANFKETCECPKGLFKKENKCEPRDGKLCDDDCGYGYCVDKKCVCVEFSILKDGKCILDAEKVCASKTLTKDDTKCLCTGKYKQAPDGITCQYMTCADKNATQTCQDMGATCEMKWTGINPGYSCKCPEGYLLDEKKGICTDPCSNLDVSRKCIEKNHFCYNSYADINNLKGDCVCPPPLAADKDGKCVKIAEYVYLMSDIPVMKKKYEMEHDIDHILLNSHLIKSLSQTFSADVFDYGHLHDYEIKGNLVLSSVWIRFKRDPSAELKRYLFQAQNFNNACDDCDESLYVWPPSLILSKNDIDKVELEKLDLCSPALKNKLCGVEAVCNKNTCSCPKGYRAIEYTILHISGDTTILRCEVDKTKEIDECKRGTHECPENTTCVKIPGNYICKCKPGFQKDTENDKKPCSDLCTPSPCKNGKCSMKENLFNCQCPQGFKGSLCDEKDDSLATAKNSTVIVGAVLGVLLAVLIIAFIVMYRKMRQSTYSEDFMPAPRQDHAAEMMERRPVRGVVNKSYE